MGVVKKTVYRLAETSHRPSSESVGISFRSSNEDGVGLATTGVASKDSVGLG